MNSDENPDGGSQCLSEFLTKTKCQSTLRDGQRREPSIIHHDLQWLLYRATCSPGTHEINISAGVGVFKPWQAVPPDILLLSMVQISPVSHICIIICVVSQCLICHCCYEWRTLLDPLRQAVHSSGTPLICNALMSDWDFHPAQNLQIRSWSSGMAQWQWWRLLVGYKGTGSELHKCQCFGILGQHPAGWGSMEVLHPCWLHGYWFKQLAFSLMP